MLYIFPCSLLNPKKCDEYFLPQLTALESLGHETKLVNLEALTQPMIGVVTPWRSLAEEKEAIYRGWMLPPEYYAIMEQELKVKGITLKTPAAAYRRGHELPGWYDALRAYTPKTVELVDTTVSRMVEALQTLDASSVWLRDYSKSLKYNLEASYIKDATDYKAAVDVVATFIEDREEISGAILLREFENFIGAEVRSWWINGSLRLLTPHPDTPLIMPTDPTLTNCDDWLPSGFQESLKTLELPFVTADFALRKDGAWRLIEVGDGQVSDIPADYPLDIFYSSLEPY